MAEEGGKGRMNILIGVGKSGPEKGKGMGGGEMDAKTAAGQEVLDAIADKDPLAVCEAIKSLMQLESYEDEDMEEETEAAE